MMLQRRWVMTGFFALAAVPAVAQGYPPPRPYGDDDEDEHRRYEERRREEEERRRAYYGSRGPGDGGRTYALEQQRNERVLHLQQQLGRGEINRRQFDYGVAEIDRELNDRLFNR